MSILYTLYTLYSQRLCIAINDILLSMYIRRATKVFGGTSPPLIAQYCRTTASYREQFNYAQHHNHPLVTRPCATSGAKRPLEGSAQGDNPAASKTPRTAFP